MTDDRAPLLGVMRGVRPDAECTCGCAAVEHMPCCGCCSNCGNRRCPEFDGAAP